MSAPITLTADDLRRIADTLDADTETMVALIDAIDSGDPESAHAMLDDLLYDRQPPEVRDAIDRLIDRCDWWVTG